ncbi:MAG: hypothetical protein J5653_01305 [Clostridiales bacterium]|nr:hypothetical protein [Clostridiales bacterium]
MNKKERARQIILYAVYITSVCCLQVTFPHVFGFFGRTCDLMLVFVVLSGYLFGTIDGIVVGLLVGMLRDYFSGPVITGMNNAPVAVLGIGLLAFLYVGILSSILFRTRFRRKYTLGLVQVAMVSAMYYSLGHILSWLYLKMSRNIASYHSIRYILLSSIFPQILVNVIAAIPILLLLRFVGPYKKGIKSGLVDGYSVEDRRWQKI